MACVRKKAKRLRLLLLLSIFIYLPPTAYDIIPVVLS